MNKKATYNKTIDLIKAFAIITVVLGHCIQFGSGSHVLNMGIFFENTLFKLIYSFHMPLFMLISGYLFGFSIKKYTFHEIILNRFNTLLIPILSWTFILLILEFPNVRSLSFTGIFYDYTKLLVSNFWFLWAIFYCSFIVLILNKFMNDRIFPYIFILILTLFLPDSYNLSLYKYMYPYFVLGYFYNKYSFKNTLSDNTKKKLLSLSAFTFCLMFRFFTYDSYIYTSGYTLIDKDICSQLSTNIYRFSIGLLGSLVVILCFSLIANSLPGKLQNSICLIGKNSLGIYLISGILFIYILPKITQPLTSINYAIIALETIIILFLSLMLCFSLRKNIFLNKIFLGGRS